MEPIDIAGVFNELIRYETELWDAVDKRLRSEHELPLTWLELMRVMERTPRCRVNDIVEALSITVGGASKLVDRIAAAGFCKRELDPGDKRSSLLALTATGQEKFAAADQTFRQELDRCMGAVVPQRSLTQLASILSRLRQGLVSSGEKQ